MTQVHNLDDSVEEYFEFIVKGHAYRFRHPNTEEIEQIQKLESSDKASNELLFKFISKVDEKSPDFQEISKKMIAKNWLNFRDMIKSEFGG